MHRFFWMGAVLAGATAAVGNGIADERKPAAVSTIRAEALREFRDQPERVQRLIREALELTRRDLTYVYGSHDPDRGGMDCSGTIYRLFRDHGVKEIPRSSYAQYHWLAGKGTFREVGAREFGGEEFEEMRPGDLLFWTGTYEPAKKRVPPISHVMMYLGRLKDDGRPVMFGASNGRTFAGKRRHGVSVFDLRMPRVGGKSRFIGFGKAISGVEKK